MTADELRGFLTQHQMTCKEQAVQHGVKLTCGGGEIFIVYDTGKLNVQGKKTALSVAVKDWYNSGFATPAVLPIGTAEGTSAVSAGPDRRVFIVYGHDVASRESLELLLHKMGLEPIVLQDLPAQGDTIIEKLEHYLGEHGNVGYGCVLLTPDDEGHVAGSEKEKKYRARQNVVLELGMVYMCARGTRSPGYYGYSGPEFDAWLKTNNEKPQRKLMGRKTYEMLNALPAEARDEGWRKLTQQSGYLFSRTLEHCDWPGLELVRDDLVGFVRKLKQDGGSELRVLGSLSIMRQLVEGKLLDVLRLMVCPLIVPKTGVEHIFEEIPDLAFTLESHRLLDERVLLLDYLPAGPPPVGEHT